MKLNIQNTKIMASGPIISWQMDGEPVETVTDFIFLGSKITADGDWTHEIKRHLLLRRKAMTNRQLNKKAETLFANIVPSSQSYRFFSSHAWMWDWTIKKAEYWKLDAFELDAFGAGEDSSESLGQQGDQTS